MAGFNQKALLEFEKEPTEDMEKAAVKNRPLQVAVCSSSAGLAAVDLSSWQSRGGSEAARSSGVFAE